MEMGSSPLNRRVLAYAPLIETRPRHFSKTHTNSVRIDETFIKVRGQWRYLYRVIDKHGEAVDVPRTANWDLDAARRYFCKTLHDQPLPVPDRIGTDGAGPYPLAIADSCKDGLLPGPSTTPSSASWQDRRRD